MPQDQTTQTTTVKPPKPKPLYEPDPSKMLLEGTSPGDAAPKPVTQGMPQPTGGGGIDQTIQTANQTATTTGTAGNRGFASRGSGGATQSLQGPNTPPACPEGQHPTNQGGSWECVPNQTTPGGEGGGGEEGGGGGTEPQPGDSEKIKQWWEERGMPWNPNDPEPWYSYADFEKYMNLWEGNQPGAVAGLSDDELAAFAHATISGGIDKAEWMRYMPFRDDSCPARRPFAPDCEHWKKAGMPWMDGPCPTGTCLEKPQDWSGAGTGGAGGGGGGGGATPGPGTGAQTATNYEPQSYTTYDQSQLQQMQQQVQANAALEDQTRKQVQGAIPGGTRTTGSIWPSVLNM
jgi:hypothetical protein